MKETTNKYIAGFAETSEGWSIKSLGELADIYRGASPRPIKDPKWFSEKSTHGWIRISDVTKSKKYLLKTEQYLSPDGINNSRTVSPGDLIMSICGTIGRPIILKINACIHDGFVVFSNLKEHLVDTEYLRYTILTLTEYFKSQGQPGTQVNLNTSIVEKAKVLLPPLKEQQKIAEILSTVDEQIEQTEKLIEKTKELKKGLMQQLLTKGIGHTEFKQSELGEIPQDWELSSLGSLFVISSGLTPLRANQKYFDQGQIPWVKTLDLNNKYIVKTQECITELALNETSIKLIPKNTVLLAMYGGFNQIGRTGLLQMDATTNQAISALLPKNNTNIYSEFLQTYLNANVNRWKKFAASSRKDPNLTKNDVESFSILIPPLKEQQKIASILSTVDEQIESYEKEKAKYGELKKGLMQQLLTGKVRVKVN